MRSRLMLLLIAAQFIAVPAFAQRGGHVERWPLGNRGGDRDRGRTEQPAQPRQAAPPAATRDDGQRRGPGGGDARRDDRREGRPEARGDERRDERRDDRRDNARGNDRDDRRDVRRDGRYPDRYIAPRPAPRVYVVRPPAYRYINPRPGYWYDRGVGGGYFYYEPYGRYRTPLYRYGVGIYGRGYTSDFGEVRFRVSPRNAEVYIDGAYAGLVDDFDGTFQGLKLESGTYHVEIVAPDFEPIEVDLRVTPGQRLTYRGVLQPLR